jgi:hypothetical protein
MSQAFTSFVEGVGPIFQDSWQQHPATLASVVISQCQPCLDLESAALTLENSQLLDASTYAHDELVPACIWQCLCHNLHIPSK